MLAPPWLPEKFQPVRLLGKGGMGEVWLVEEPSTGRTLACKWLRLEMEPEEMQAARLRFKREFLVLSKLRHPGIARAHELFEPGDGLAYTMDYVDGWPLREYFLAGHWADGTPTPNYFMLAAGTGKAVAAMSDLLGMLAWLHGSGVIHRDLKPANLMMDRGGRLRLIDFGLAREDDEKMKVTQVGEILGTPSYIAPEQIRGQRLDGRADLYSCGVILYQLLTGVLPFKGPVAEVLMAHLSQAPKSPREINPLLSGPLAGFVLRLLAKTPQARFATAEEAQRGLHDAAAESAGGQDETSALERTGPLIGQGLLLTTPYEGNGNALAAVAEFCSGLQEQGRGSLLLVSGNAGGGKSRLIDELRGAAVERGVKLLRGACHEGAAGQLFNDIFQPLAEEMARHPDRARRWLGADGELLAHHFPVLRRIDGLRAPPTPGLEPASAKAQLMGALFGFFSRLAREERVIVAAEDLHWADGLTLELLGHLIRSFALPETCESPLAVAVNYRIEEIIDNPGLDKWLAAWTGGRVRRLKLRPLDPQEAARLIQGSLGVADAPGEATVRRVCELTGGNPFFILELLRAGREQLAQAAGDPIQPLGRWLREERGAVPESLASVLQRRLGDLGAKAGDALGAAAILGRVFTFDLWREVSGLGEDELFELADQALKREIFTEIGADRLQFSHDLFRRQLLQAMSGMKRRRLHGRAAQALISRPRPGEGNSALIARHAIEAGMRPEAVAFGLPALRGLIDSGEFAQAWSLLENLGALFSAQEPMAPSDEIEWQGIRGRLLLKRGSAAEAASIQERAWERLRELPAGAARDRQEIRILTGLAFAYERQGLYDRQIGISRQMFDLATALGDVPDQFSTLRAIGNGLASLGDFAGTESHLARAESLLPGIPDESLRMRLAGHLCNSRSLLEHHRGRMAESARWSVRALESAQTLNDKGRIAVSSGNLGELEHQLGRLTEAKRRLESARKLNEEIGNRVSLSDNLNNLALCALYENRYEAAQSLLQQSLALSGETANQHFAALACIHLARVLAGSGDPEGAVARLDEASAIAEKLHNPAIGAKTCATRAALQLQYGNFAAARAAGVQAVEISGGRYTGDEALAGAATAAAEMLAGGVAPEKLAPQREQLLQALASAIRLENIPLEFEIRLIAANCLQRAGFPEEALARLADTGPRAKAAGFAGFAGRADALSAARTAACRD